MKTLISEGDRLANVLLTSIKEHYGIRSEKVAEFGAQPFRGRKPKKALEVATPPPSGSSHA